MDNMLDIALECARRGWHVFPCWPCSKKPMTHNGFKDATISEEQIRIWWNSSPGANVAIATGLSGLCVLDVDEGISIGSLSGVSRWMESHNLPDTLAIRTGRRPGFGLQLYYSGQDLQSTGWRLPDGSRGDIRCATGYVMAAGSIHPDSRLPYEVLRHAPIVPVPDSVRSLTSGANSAGIAVTVDDATADAWKTWLLSFIDKYQLVWRGYEKRVTNGWWLGILCPWDSIHRSGMGVESSTVLGILDGKLAFECSHGSCKGQKHNTDALKELLFDGSDTWLTEPGADIEVTLGLPKPKEETEPKDWRDRYMTAEYAANVKPPTFLIDDFLPKGSITMLAGAVAQRKSIVAINIIHALLTGEQLFGHFNVTEQPTRVIYLCPEMGAAQTLKRLKSLGLMEYIGKTLFLQTMDQDSTPIDDLSDSELSGAVVVLDTITRFIDGDENKVEDMRKFAKKVFRLKRCGATALLLHHNKKGGSDSLDAMRGSSELGAFLDGCWTTSLSSMDPEQAYKCDSTMHNVKQRDFESDSFNLIPMPGEYRLAYRISPKSPTGKELSNRKADEIVLRMITENPGIGINKIRAALKAAKIGHSSPEYVRECKARVLGTGTTLRSD